MGSSIHVHIIVLGARIGGRHILLSLVIWFTCILHSYTFGNQSAITRIREKYQSPEYHRIITDIVTNCSRHDLDVRIDCSDAVYINSIIKSKRSSSDKQLILKANAKIKVLSEDASYPKIFEEFIVQQKPFVAPFAGGNKTSISIGNDVVYNIVTHDYSLQAEDILDLTIPAVASNNYLRRLQTARKLSSSNNDRADHSDSSDSSIFDVTSQWPAVFKTSHDSEGKVHRCPHRMHQVVWHTTDGAATDVRIFLESEADKLTPVSNENLPLHYQRNEYSSNGFASSEIPNFMEYTLMQNQYLFVPNNFLLSAKASVNSRDSVQQLARVCFVDASNFNLFLESMSVSSIIDSNHHSVYTRLKSQSFNKDMSRAPNDLSFQQYLHEDDVLTGDQNESEIAVSKITTTSGSSRSRQKKSQSSFRGWQDKKKWDASIKALTLPIPDIPLIGFVGRNSVTLTWESQFATETSDVTKFGYKVITCLPAASIQHGPDCITDVFIYGSNLTESRRVYPTDGSLYSVFTVRVENLLANTEYVVNVILLYNDAESLASDTTAVIKTLPLSIPQASTSFTVRPAAFGVSLDITPNEDDGGLAVVGYHLYMQIRDSATLKNIWQYYGFIDISKSIELTNLLPDSVYMFKLSAVNAMGNSSYTISNEVYVTSSSILTSETYHTIKTSTSGESTTKINMQYSTITLVKSGIDGIEIDGWRCHWSPALNVEGELVLADPFLATDSIKVSIFRKIAVVLRGDNSISQKAQFVQVSERSSVACILYIYTVTNEVSRSYQTNTLTAHSLYHHDIY